MVNLVGLISHEITRQRAHEITHKVTIFSICTVLHLSGVKKSLASALMRQTF